MSGSPVDPKPVADRLVGLAVAALAIAVMLYYAVHLLEAVAGFLVGIVIVVVVIYVGWQWHARRRSGW
jgi:uncharacterized membrane protein YcaP (DUF421 family)